MQNIATELPAFKRETVIASCETSCDTAGLFVYRPPAGMRRMLENAQQGEIETRDVFGQFGFKLGVLFEVNRPRLAVLPVMDWLVKTVPWCWHHRFDIAYDFKGDKERILTTLDQNGELKWASRKARKVQYENTIYFASERSREVRLYPKDAKDAIRLELSFTGQAMKRTLRWLGMSEFEDLPRLNSRKLLAHHFKLVGLKEDYKTKAIQEVVKEDRERHLRNGVETDAFRDQYRSGIAGRARHSLERMDMFGFKRHVRKSSRFVEGLDMGWLELVPSHLKWPEVEGGVIENKQYFSGKGVELDLPLPLHLGSDSP